MTSPVRRHNGLALLHDDLSLTPSQMLHALTAELNKQILDISGWPTVVEPAQLSHDIRHILWHFVGISGGWQPGAFTADLINLISHADRSNYQRLKMVYPVHAILFQHVQQHGAWVLQRAVGEI